MALAGNLLQVQATREDGVRESSQSVVLFIARWNRPMGIYGMNRIHNLSIAGTETHTSHGSWSFLCLSYSLQLAHYSKQTVPAV